MAKWTMTEALKKRVLKAHREWLARKYEAGEPPHGREERDNLIQLLRDENVASPVSALDKLSLDLVREGDDWERYLAARLLESNVRRLRELEDASTAMQRALRILGVTHDHVDDAGHDDDPNGRAVFWNE